MLFSQITKSKLSGNIMVIKLMTTISLFSVCLLKFMLSLNSLEENLLIWL